METRTFRRILRKVLVSIPPALPLLRLCLELRLQRKHQFAPHKVRHIPAGQLIPYDPEFCSALALELLLDVAERNAVLMADTVAIVTVHNGVSPQGNRHHNLAVGKNVFFKLMVLVLCQRRDNLFKFGIDFQFLKHFIHLIFLLVF
jgi:hypothetical protein